MGIVASQSLKNMLSTYLGFFIGAINTLFLFTQFLSDEYYGMVGYMLSLANLVMPLMTFGVHNTLIKFYTSFKTRVSLNSFLTLMLFLPLVIIFIFIVLTHFSYNLIGEFLSTKNSIIKDYLWHSIIIAIALAYFEVFYAWVKVQMKTVYGNFMKEVFHRVGILISLFCLHFKYISIEQFMHILVGIYVLKMFLMLVYAFNIKSPVFTFKKISNLKVILKYSFLIIIAGSIATSLLDIDKVMLGYYISIEEIAYYNVAIFIAAVIAVPMRSMHQILLPLSAKYLNEKKFIDLKDLYKRSSLNLFIISGFIFLLIILNINQLYLIIPEEFNGGLFVVFMISLVKLFDAVLGNNNAILFNSDYYRLALFFGVVLVILMVFLNIIFIPYYGINGAALATFIAVFLYNSIKLFFVYKKFKMLPFSIKTIKILSCLILAVLLLYFWDFNFHPVINIVLKSILISILYGLAVYLFKFSENITAIIDNIVKCKL